MYLLKDLNLLLLQKHMIKINVRVFCRLKPVTNERLFNGISNIEKELDQTNAASHKELSSKHDKLNIANKNTEMTIEQMKIYCKKH